MPTGAPYGLLGCCCGGGGTGDVPTCSGVPVDHLLIDIDWNRDGVYEDADNEMPWVSDSRAYMYDLNGGTVAYQLFEDFTAGYGLECAYVTWTKQNNGFFWICFGDASNATSLLSLPPCPGLNTTVYGCPDDPIVTGSQSQDIFEMQCNASDGHVNGHEWRVGGTFTRVCSGTIYTADSISFGIFKTLGSNPKYRVKAP
jgi:hypothetical protein